MRALLSSLALLAAIPLAVHAQRAPATFSLGLKGGTSFSNLTSSYPASSRYLWGFQASVAGQLALGQRLALQVEALYF